MAPGRGRLLERLDGLVEAREDVRLAVGLDAGDRALEVGDAAQRLGPDDPVGGLVEGDDAELVRAVSAAAARRIASLPMSTLRTPGDLGRRRCRG